MIAAVYGLVAAIAIALGGNAARLTGAVASHWRRIGALVLGVTAGQAAVAMLMAFAGSRMVHALDPAWSRVLAAGALAFATLLVLAPARPRLPAEPTHSLGAISLVCTAYAARDGLALLAFALGLVSPDFAGVAAAVALGTLVSSLLATRGGVALPGTAARYVAAILLAAGAFYIGAIAS